MAGDRAGVRLGSQGGEHPRRGGRRGGRRAPAAVGAAGCDGRAPGEGGSAGVFGGALPEGQQELLGRAVPPPRHRRGAARTNNALEQLFGSYRHHERRTSGRKVASPALVLRGSARIIAAVATRQREFTADDLAGAGRAEWSRLRQELDVRRQRRTERRRASAKTPMATCGIWRRSSSSQVCRPRFFKRIPFPLRESRNTIKDLCGVR